MTADKLREKFEMFCKENHWCVNRQRNGDYKSMLIENMWIGYRAAHASRDAEVEALRKDAERYREFRRAAIREDDSFVERMMLRIPDKDCTESQFNEAIDAAMQNDT